MENSEINKQAKKYTLQSLDKALRVLDLFYEYRELGPSDVEAAMDMNRSIAFRILTTFHENGYLIKTDSGRYRLGMKLFSLGQVAYGHAELISYARPQLLKLAECCGETSNLAVLDGDKSVIFLDKGISHSPLRMDTTIGSRYIAHLTASGKAILAHQPRSVVLEYLEKTELKKLTNNSPTDVKEIMSLLRTVRQRGWGEDREEAIPGLTCFAAPILDLSNQSVAAISVSGATTRMTVNEEEKIQMICQSARIISKLIW